MLTIIEPENYRRMLGVLKKSEDDLEVLYADGNAYIRIELDTETGGYNLTFQNMVDYDDFTFSDADIKEMGVNEAGELVIEFKDKNLGEATILRYAYVTISRYDYKPFSVEESKPE